MKRTLVVLSAALLVALVGGGFHWKAQAAHVEPSITPNESNVALGDTVTFTTAYPNKYKFTARIAVSCYQDVNGDNVIDTGLLGPDIVFSWVGLPDDGVELGATVSIWTLRGGGPAECRADLASYGDTDPVLASTEFHANG